MPNVLIPKIHPFHFFIDPKRIAIYPTRPTTATGIPKIVASAPFVTASQFTVALIVQNSLGTGER